MSRIFKLLSIAIHAIVISALVIAQLLAAGPRPVPHQPSIFDAGRVVRIVDIPLPPAHRTPSASEAPATISSNAAPLEPPDGMTDETGRENALAGVPSPFEVPGAEGGASLDSIGVTDHAPPLPSAPPPAPQTPIRLHSGIRPPRRIGNEPPVYPSIAQSVRVEGVVILEAVIDPRGNVESVRVLRSIPLLDRAAVDAVKRWRFTPALLNGDAVAVVMTVTVNFVLK